MEKIKKQEGVYFDFNTLFFAGKELQGNFRLIDLNIKNGSKLYLKYKKNLKVDM